MKIIVTYLLLSLTVIINCHELIAINTTSNNYTVILGSVREQRQGHKLAKVVVQSLKEKGHKVTLVDPKEYPLPLLDKRYHDYKGNDAPKVLTDLAHIFEQSDGIIVVSPTYNGGMPAPLKNMLDHFYGKPFTLKTAGIVTYSGGSYGGYEIIPSLRNVLSTLGMITVPNTISIPKISKKFAKDGSLLDDKLPSRVNKFIEKLDWYTSAVKVKKATS